jgi:hypothetical protein
VYKEKLLFKVWELLFKLFVCNFFRKGLLHLAFSTDKKWKKLPDPGAIVSRKRSKQIFFVRHGESAWNVVFNRGFGPSFPGRLLSAVFDELRVLPSLDSVFVDSPLSPLGCKQVLFLFLYFLFSYPSSSSLFVFVLLCVYFCVFAFTSSFFISFWGLFCCIFVSLCCFHMLLIFSSLFVMFVLLFVIFIFSCFHLFLFYVFVLCVLF